MPGITAIAAPGHTPGHMALSIASKGKQLIHIGDAVLHPLHLEHPNWLPIFDWCPNKAAQTKQRLFDRASQEEALVFAHHLSPFPNLGHVIRQKTGWSWQPTEIWNSLITIHPLARLTLIISACNAPAWSK